MLQKMFLLLFYSALPNFIEREGSVSIAPFTVVVRTAISNIGDEIPAILGHHDHPGAAEDIAIVLKKALKLEQVFVIAVAFLQCEK